MILNEEHEQLTTELQERCSKMKSKLKGKKCMVRSQNKIATSDSCGYELIRIL
jgi:hypothetical protein